MCDRNNSVYGKETWEITHRITINYKYCYFFIICT